MSIQADYTLDTNIIDIWQIDLSSQQYLQAAKRQLNNDELKRANRYYFDKHSRRFSLARAVTKQLLSRYLNNEKITFSYNNHGKPYIGNHKIEFNLSHSQDTALLAVGLKSALGIDIEFFSKRKFLGLAKYAFSSHEQHQLESLSHDSELLESAFFHIWAQKEALIKAEGTGLSYDTQSFSVSEKTPAKLLSQQKSMTEKWQLRSFQPLEGCWGALCCHQNVTCINYFNFNWQTFNENIKC